MSVLPPSRPVDPLPVASNPERREPTTQQRLLRAASVFIRNAAGIVVSQTAAAAINLASSRLANYVTNRRWGRMIVSTAGDFRQEE